MDERRIMLVATLVVLASASPLEAQAAESKRALTVQDLSLVKDVGRPHISPSGEWVAYTITEVDALADVTRSDIWLTRWDGSQTIQLTSTPASEHTPRWSPDGHRIAFLSTGTDSSVDQLWLIDQKGEHLKQVTTLEHGITDFDWAPNSRTLVLVSEVALDNKPKRTADGPIVIDRMLFKRDGYGYLANVRSNLHLLDLEEKSAIQLTDGPHHALMPSFSPNGKLIAYVTKLGDDPDRHDNWDILTTVPKAGARPKRISESNFMECDPVWGWNTVSPSWSPDSRHIACIQSGDLDLSWFTLHQVVIFTTMGDAGKQPTAMLDRNTLQPGFSADGKQIYFLLEDDQSTLLASITTDGRDLQRLTPATSTVSDYNLGPDGKIAVLTSSDDSPLEIAALENGNLRQLTFANKELLASVSMMKTESVSYKAADGTELHGLIMKPPGFQEGVRYPTIFRLHGGPVAQWQHEFDFTWQLLAANGYVVFGPNPRGSSGRGEEFQKTIFGDWGNADVPDVLAAVNYLVAAGVADEERLGIGGWSAGAMLTNYTIASDTRFRAATSGAGVSNMLAGFGTDEWWKDWEAELGLPWETPENWARVSYPFLHADRIKTPTLFLCGSEDYNVPVIHSEQMYMALKRLGVPTQLIIYPGESHGIGRPSFQRDVLQRYLSWYEQWLH